MFYQEAGFVCSQQPVDLFIQFNKQRSQLLFIGKFNILIREIEFQLHHGGGINNLLAELFNMLSQLSFKLLMSGIQGLFAFGMDEVADGLGLTELHLAIEGGPLGKLTGLGGSDTQGQDSFQNGLGYQNTTMTGDFYRFFTRIRFRSTKESNQYLVYNLSVGVCNIAKVDGVGVLFSKSRSFESFVYCLDSIITGDTDDGNTAFTHRGGNGGYGFLLADTVVTVFCFIHKRNIRALQPDIIFCKN